MDKIKIIIVSLIILVGVGMVGYWAWSIFVPNKLDSFAQCLKDKGIKFYGAFWCSHCQNEKHLFGSAARYLPYIECSAPDGNSQLKLCNDAHIQSYPTFEFSDGSRQVGEMTLKELADKSGCQLP